jgi:uncharacterized membrane-anchored protein
MRTKIALLDLIARRNLDAKTAAALWSLAGFDRVPPRLLFKARSSLLIVGASMLGLGLIYGVATNWALLSRFQQFTLLQLLVLGPCAGMAAWARGRTPLALLALASSGALFAYFGQTYPSGADNWQLFALWAGLGLPLAVCARADSVWSLWTVVVLIGIALWDSAHTPFGREVDAHNVHAAAVIGGLLLTVAMSPVGHRYTGAGRWAYGIALVPSLLYATTTAILDLHHSFSIYYTFCVILIGVAALAITQIKPFDVLTASVVALSLVVLVVDGFEKLVLPGIWHNWLGPLLLIGLVAIGMTVGAVKIILLLARSGEPQERVATARRINRILRDAVAQGLLDDDVVQAAPDAPHWSIVALSAFAAWLSVVPLTALIVLASSRDLYESIGVVVGMPLLVGSVLMLRREQLSLYVEQLGLPGLLSGGTLVFYQVERQTESVGVALGVLVPIAAMIAALVPRTWIRVLAGTAIGVLIATSLSSPQRFLAVPKSWLLWLPVVGLWLLLYTVQQRIILQGKSAQWIAGLEAVMSGMAVAALTGIACSSQPTFLITKAFTDFGLSPSPSIPDGVVARSLSVALAAGAGACMAWRWPPFRVWWQYLVVGLASLTAWFVPALGPVLVILSICLVSGRHMQAALAGVCAVWLLIALYYTEGWTLATKALLLTGVGVTVALIACFAIVGPKRLAEPLVKLIRLDQRPRIRFLLCGMLVLAVTNTAIWQKESLVKNGALVYIELALSDPRSLMQGDYMRLDFALPWPKCDILFGCGSFATPSAVVARVDPRGIAQLPRFYYGGPLAPGEFLIELVLKSHGLTIVTDAWYFKEGEAKRWSRARYGEFRVTPDGKAVLTGLRGANLGKL